ncbi:MAG: hypothetical protein WAN10_12955 [Candidatus Acidiferrales bacterium]
MKRSGDITASAIILFFGSGCVICLGLLMAFSVLTTQPQIQPSSLLFMLFAAYALPCGWGIANAVGILRLRPWARISTIVMSAAAACFCGFIALAAALVPLLTKGETGIDPGETQIVMIILCFLAVIPLSIAIWWLVLFTRKRVALEFATGGASASATQSFGYAPVHPAAVDAQIPLSIRIIAILEIAVKTPLLLLGEFSAVRHHSPALLLGFLVPHRVAPLMLALLVVGSLICAIATLRTKQWGLDGLTVYALFGLVNAPLVLLSRARVTYADIMARRLVTDSGMSPQAATQFQQALSVSIYIVAFVLSAVILYFLPARRKAFRAVCAARVSAASTGQVGAQ